MDERLTPDFVMVNAIENIPALAKQIWPGQPKKNAVPPFVFYLQTDDSEEDALDRRTGLQHTGYAVHVVAGDYYSLAVIGGKIKAAVSALAGRAWSRSDSGIVNSAIVDLGVSDAGGEALYFEDINIRQTSPDLFEEDVYLFRRIYQVDIDYQTERSESA